MAAVAVRAVRPFARAPRATVSLPGSKSLTNRALACAAQARGRSRLTGALFAEDTLAMAAAVAALGCGVETDPARATIVVDGKGRLGATPSRIDARRSGTTGRFALPLAALGTARIVVDGDPQLRARPFGPAVSALRSLGAWVQEEGEAGRLPVAVRGPLRGGRTTLPGDVSSQFLSGLLMAGPSTELGVELELSSPLVSAPYVSMTASVMSAFGVEPEGLAVAPGAYRPTEYAVEPDASAASYFFAAAAITGGEVAVEGLGTSSVQGDLAFVDLLERMGAVVERAERRIVVAGGRELRGIEADMSDCSDVAPTLAVVAACASTPSVVRGIGFIRAKESDRVGGVVAELRRAGVDATEDAGGFTIRPGGLHGARLRTYGDHRMAMSLALLGLRVPGIEIEDPGCVEKTFPDYFERLEGLAAGAA